MTMAALAAGIFVLLLVGYLFTEGTKILEASSIIVWRSINYLLIGLLIIFGLIIFASNL
jgi:hypothetical protein